MCTPWTIARLIRWRQRQWASNVFACGLPSDDKSDTFDVPHLFPRTRIVQVKDEMKSHVTDQETSSYEKCNLHRSISSSAPDIDTEPPENENDSQWLPFTDEHYIVFCFKEDGAFEVQKDEKSEASNSLECTVLRLRPVDRMLIYSEEADIVDKSSQDCMLSIDGVGFEPTSEKGEDGESIYFDPESPRPEIREEQYEENEEYRTISLESSISTESDGSTSSFAFPALYREWSGSPIKMPKSHLRNYRDRRIGLHCCRF